MICNRTSKIQEEIEINNLLKCAPIEQSLYLKEGTRVMCTVNKDMDKGICNGPRNSFRLKIKYQFLLLKQ